MQQIKNGKRDILVSVIIPVFQTDSSLFDDCLSSISRQSLSPSQLEVCIILDGDQGPEVNNVVSRWRSSLSIQCKTIDHAGVSAARNAGIDASQGKWILFVDADDTLPGGCLADFIAFANRESCDIAFGDSVALFGTTQEERRYGESNIGRSSELAKTLRHEVLLATKSIGVSWGKIYRGDFLRQSGIKFNIHLAMGEDSDFVFRLLQHTDNVGYFHHIVYEYHRNTQSTVLRFREDYSARILSTLLEMRKTIDGLPDKEVYIEDYNNYVLFHLLLMVAHYFFNPNAPWDDRQRRERYTSVLCSSPYREALESNAGRDFSLARRITLFCLRHNYYWMSKMIGTIRYRQFGD